MGDYELTELKKISKILLLSNATSIEQELSRYATTSERKRIWAMISGIRTQDEIARDLNLGRRTVNTFMNLLETAQLVEAPRGKPPRRILDYVPPSWLELVTPVVVEPAQVKSDSSPQKEQLKESTQ